jgi:hypothetical protein
VVAIVVIVVEIPAKEFKVYAFAVISPEAVTLVALAAPNVGVTRVGDVANTNAPEPVSSVTAEARFADEGVARKVATFAARPETPVEIGNPVQFVSVPDEGVPSAGVTNVGLVANTNAPEPVSSVTAEARFADEGVARKVATFAARPETPLEIGNPVQFVSVPDEGVPSAGVTRVGDVANTNAPEPVSSVTAEARFADEGVARKVATFAARPVIFESARFPSKVDAVTTPTTFILVTASPTRFIILFSDKFKLSPEAISWS